jgi:hypothetical protein
MKGLFKLYLLGFVVLIALGIIGWLYTKATGKQLNLRELF